MPVLADSLVESIGSEITDPVIRYAGNHAILSVASITDRTFEITLYPLETIHSTPEDLPASPFLKEYDSRSLWNSRTIMDPVRGSVGDHILEILRTPLRIILRDEENNIIQQLTWPESSDGRLEFMRGDALLGPTNNGDWIEISNGKSESDLSEEIQRDDLSMLIDPAAGWALFYHHPENGTRLTFDGENGVLTPDPNDLVSPVQLFLTIWDDVDQLQDEYHQFAEDQLLNRVESAAEFIQNLSGK
ncbi:hypothetical protein [Rhodohalobacter sp. SW132]|uniref:hypothetical protein n=1 Tax=Rhodohalobacter sp. SW132 TaxID=2293433 RepID=UPI0011C05B47|nr:hypothetical protein [Rhodohalobacter sp. SW132]